MVFPINQDVEDLVQEAMAEAVANIQDINFPWKPRRSITVEISLQPNETRDYLEIGVKVSTKLVTAKGTKSYAFLSENGQIEEQVREKQLFIPTDEEEGQQSPRLVK